jgi:hypothetical protein
VDDDRSGTGADRRAGDAQRRTVAPAAERAVDECAPALHLVHAAGPRLRVVRHEAPGLGGAEDVGALRPGTVQVDRDVRPVQRRGQRLQLSDDADGVHDVDERAEWRDTGSGGEDQLGFRQGRTQPAKRRDRGQQVTEPQRPVGDRP